MLFLGQIALALSLMAARGLLLMGSVRMVIVPEVLRLLRRAFAVSGHEFTFDLPGEGRQMAVRRHSVPPTTFCLADPLSHRVHELPELERLR